MAAPGVSRKDKRKHERVSKKLEKHKRQRKNKNDVPAGEKRVRAHAPPEIKPVKTNRRDSSITNRFHEFLAEAASAKGKSQSWGVEDKEIKALEVKLGLGSSSSAKSDSALKKLQREYSKDGLGEDFADFLSGLDHISDVVKAQPKSRKSARLRADDVQDESDEDEEVEAADSCARSEDGSDFEDDDVEMDEETRREIKLLQAEDAEFLRGMEELPTDESEDESDTDLACFYSNEEEDEACDGV